MTLPRRFRPFVLALAGLLAAATAATATSYVMVDDPLLAAQAELIVDARVVAVESAPVSGRPATDYTIEVERVLDGAAPGTTLIVRVPGGVRPDGVGLKIYGAPHFVTGERALLFLLPRADGTFGILHLGLGAFHRVELGGAPPVAIRDLRDATEVELPGGATDPRRHLARDFDRFSTWLEDRAAGTVREPDYFVADAGSALQRLTDKFTLFEQQGLNLRWFEFDSGGDVAWFAHPDGEPGVPGGGFAEFQQALSTWTREPTTPVRLTYNGTGSFSSGFSSFDNRNTLLHDDPNDEMPGTFSCFGGGGGTIAIGGPWFASSERGTFQGKQYIRILGADIVTNEGISCLITTSSCGSASVIGLVYTHELGHGLGIGHSCGDAESPGCGTSSRLNDAVMRAFVHRDCRPIGIRADDADALRALYGSSGGGGGGPRGPTAPTGLSGDLVVATVELAWEDRSTTETGFRVYRSANGSPFAEIAEVGADVTHLFDDDVAPASTYRYQVTAFDTRAESAKSNTLEVVVPPAAPVGVGISILGGGGIEVGDPVALLAAFSGPAERAFWDFGDGAVGFNDTPCGAGTFCRTQIFTSPGTHTVRVTIRGPFGQTAVDTLQVSVADAPFAPAEESAFIQSVIFGRRGDTGTFESDVWLHNAGPVAGLAEVTFLPRGAEAAPPTKTVTLAPAESLFLPNVLATLFEQSAGQGSVLLRFLQEGPGAAVRPGIHAISRSFVDLANRAEGSFGQFVPAQREGEWSAADKVATGIIQDEDFIATLLAANVDDKSGQVDVELFDRLGAMVGDPASFVLGAKTMRFRSLPDLFPVLREQTEPGFTGTLHEGPYTARFSSNGIRFLASSTLLETGSEDQIFIPAEEPREAAELYLPRVVRSPGQFGVFLTTAVAVLNNAAVPTDLTFQLLLRGQNNSAPLTKSATVGAGELLYFEDVIEDLFGLETATGAVRVLWDNGADIAPRLLAMTLSQNPQGEVFGMLIDSETAADAVVGQGVAFGSEQSNLFRTQYGAVNLRTARTDLTLTLRDANGTAVATAVVALQARQHLEVNLVTLFGPVAETGRNWSVTTQVEGGGPVLTYFANINTSGDVFFVPGLPLFEALAAPGH